MTDPEASVKENTKEVFEKKMNEENVMINKALKEHGFFEMIDDKTIDMVASLVSKKIQPSVVSSTDLKPSTESEISFDKTLNVIVAILTILFMAIVIYSFFNSDSKAKTPVTGRTLKGDGEEGEEYKINFPDNQNTLTIGQFEFVKGNAIKRDDDYTGRAEIIKKHEDSIIGFIAQSELLEREELDKINLYTLQNFLLEGPPGTGKTIFVRFLLKRVDDKLKEKDLAAGKGGDEIQAEYEKVKENEAEKRKVLDKMPSKVVYCEIKPSMINGMYVGESEKNVGLVFDISNELAKQGLAVFMFWDEGDVFFEERGAGASGSSSPANVKSELLQRIGVRPKFDYLPVFVYCATNRADVFDDAFKRRFGNIDKFGFPSVGDRTKYVKKLLQDFKDVSTEAIDKIVSLTQGRSYAFISGQMKNFYIKNPETWIVTGFYLRKYIEHLERNKENYSIG